MHISAVLNSQWSRSRRPTSSGSGAEGLRPQLFAGRLLAGGRVDLCQGKAHSYCLLVTIVGLAVLCIGLFEATRLTTHVLRSPCTILGSEIVDVGTCSLCDDGEMPSCEAYPVATARIAVTYLPVHSTRNVTGWVWYCKGHPSMDPCQRQISGADVLGMERPHTRDTPGGRPVHCTVGEVFGYMQLHALEGDERMCYYSSRDPAGEDVWFSMPSPGLVDHVWFEKHVEYPVLLALGGLVLLALLLGCLALEGAELWATGLVG